MIYENNTFCALFSTPCVTLPLSIRGNLERNTEDGRKERSQLPLTYLPDGQRKEEKEEREIERKPISLTGSILPQLSGTSETEMMSCVQMRNIHDERGCTMAVERLPANQGGGHHIEPRRTNANDRYVDILVK